MIRKMISPISVEQSIEKRNVFVGEAFGPSNVRVVFVGAAEDTQEREDRVFLLLGPSCVREEKATCIDAFCNFFYGVQKEDKYRLHIANEKFDKTTPNKAIVTYVFNDSKMPFRPIVVDVKDDDASLLHKWLTENARLRIDVVCIVFNLLGRIETRHETAIKEMLSILPKRIRSSASVMLTNSDGNPPPVALLRRFDLQESPVYKLNWTTLFTGQPDDSLKEHLRANYWKMSENSMKEMVAHLHTRHPQTFNGLPHEPPMFALHLKPDNASSSSSSSTSTSTFIERTTTHHTTHHHYDLPPETESLQGESSPPLVKTTIFQTTSKHVEDKIVEGPPAGIPKELLKQIEQRGSSDEHVEGKKVVVEKTITVKMVKKDDEMDDTVIERARARSIERLALEEMHRREEEKKRRDEEMKRREEEMRKREQENKRREEEEREMRRMKEQLERERREREEIERKIREHQQAEISKRAKEEEERLLLIKIEEERREKYRLEQLALEERSIREADERARKMSAERREMEEERRRLDEERRRLEGRKLEELKKIEEEKLRLEEQRRILSHEKSLTEAERKRMEGEMREGERRLKEEEEKLRRMKEEEEIRRKKNEDDLRRRREEEELRRKREEEEATKRKREEDELRRRREVERKAREEEERIRVENERRREREENERKRKSMEEKNITITYERTIERTRTEEVDERVLDHRPMSDTEYRTRTYLNGDGPRHATVIDGDMHHPQSPIGDAPIVRFVFDESSRSYVHHVVEPHRHGQRELSPGRNEPDHRMYSPRTETLIDDPFIEDNGRYQHVRGPTDLRSPGIAQTPASPEMLRRAEALRRTNQDVQRDSYPSGRESRKRERTQYENLPMDEAGNAYIIPDRMRHSKSPIVMRVKMSPKENGLQSAVAPPLPPIQREHMQPVQSTPQEYSPPPLYQRTPPAHASLPQKSTPSAVHFANSVGSGAKPIGVGAGAAPADQYSTIQKPTPAQRSPTKAPVLTPPPPTQSPSHAAPPYVKPPRQLGDDELRSPAGQAPIYGIDRPGQLPPPPVPVHKHPQQRAPLARPEDHYGGVGRKPAGMSAEEERDYLLRLRPLDEYNRIPGEAEKGYRPQDATWSSKPHPIETSTPENERRKKEKKKKEPIFIIFDRHRTRPLNCWDWVLPICCFCIAPIVVILIIIGIILTYALN